MSRENSAMASVHYKRAEELAARGLNRRALTELEKAAAYADVNQINDVVACRNKLARGMRGIQRVSGDLRMDYENCVGSDRFVC
ncbi:GNAT family acetyltransferase [Edwardsiella tarda]|uniref:GNAT family acetyltransferase n=1 Tax=Edwardsiella tarda TaxID=636 RepID=UPI00351C9654